MRINQKVNFYTDDFRPPVVVLPASKILQYTGMALLLMLLIGAVIYQPIMSLEEESKTLNETLTKKKKELEETKRKYPKKLKNAALDEQLASLRTENQNKLNLLSYLKSDSLGEAQNFSQIFNDLKDYDNRNVWLTRIDVFSEGKFLKLTGLVSQPDVLPEYIDGLKDASAFKGRSFNLFNLERDADNTSHLHFVLSTDVNTQEGGSNEG